MLESIRSNEDAGRCDMPRRNLVAPAGRAAMPLLAAAAGNDADCEPIAKSIADPRVQAAPATPAALPAVAGGAARFEWVTGAQLYQLAQARRTAMQAVLIRQGWDAIREVVRRAREQHRQRRESRSIYHALHALDDRTLRDLGFHRCEILSVAAEVSGRAESTRLVPRAPRS